MISSMAIQYISVKRLSWLSILVYRKNATVSILPWSLHKSVLNNPDVRRWVSCLMTQLIHAGRLNMPIQRSVLNHMENQLKPMMKSYWNIVLLVNGLHQILISTLRVNMEINLRCSDTPIWIRTKRKTWLQKRWVETQLTFPWETKLHKTYGEFVLPLRRTSNSMRAYWINQRLPLIWSVRLKQSCVIVEAMESED